MFKTVRILPAVALLLVPGLLFALTPEESLKANFPALKVESVRESPVSGLYEVVAEGRIFYYAPAPECMVLGEMVTKDGKNLTQERELEMIGARMKRLPLARAVKIGSGKNVIVEVTDIDCQYCRTASEFLKGAGDLTRYIYFISLSGNPRTEAKIKYVLCASDKQKAYEDAMSGKLDDMKFKPCTSKEVLEMYEAHSEEGRMAAVPGTPCFLVNGNVVMGANLAEIKRLLRD